MDYRFASLNEFSKWQELANDIGEIMRVPSMGSDKVFIEYAMRKLEQRNAIIADDNGECAGVIGFSLSNNSITWLGVKQKYHRQGIGSKLLQAAMDRLDSNNKIVVNTYPENYLPERPARALYFKLGFVEPPKESFMIDGLEMVELALYPYKHDIQTEAI